MYAVRRFSRPIVSSVVRSQAHSSARPVAKSPNKSLLYAAIVFSGTIAFSLTNSSENAGWFGSSKQTVQNVKLDIIALIEADDKKRGNGTSIAGTLVRLAWHASGTYSVVDKTGGSNGSTMRYPPESTWGANAGLGLTRDFLEPIKKKYPSLSYADIWTLAGAAAIEYMGGPVIPWKPGRTDSPKPTTVPDGRLPDASKGPDHIHSVFGRMGFNDAETVALIGAHAVGRCHTDRSGHWGPWTNAETTFSNEYFRLLLEEKWTKKTTHEGKPWTGPLQYENPDKQLMMLPSDLALLADPNYKKYVALYAKDEELFFKNFASAFGKLLELGVDFQH